MNPEQTAELIEGVPEIGNTTAAVPFWLVACTEADQPHIRGPERLTRAPCFCYRCEKDAEAEALRLATKFKGYKFAVMQCVATVRWINDRPVWSEAQE